MGAVIPFEMALDSHQCRGQLLRAALSLCVCFTRFCIEEPTTEEAARETQT